MIQLRCHYTGPIFAVSFCDMNTDDLATQTASRLNGKQNLYEQVAVRISKLIQHGTLQPGERVPSVRRCSAQQNVSITTVMQAYRVLEDQGMIEGRPQSGYYVRTPRPWPPPEPEMTRPPLRAVHVETCDLILELVRAGSNPNLVRLGATLPDMALFPMKELNRTMASAGRRAPVAAHKYDVPPGNRALRVQVARRAMEAGCILTPDEIITTVGATEAINLCLRAVAEPGDVIAVESPTFFNILHIIESLGMKVCEIPTYPRDGICLDEL